MTLPDTPVITKGIRGAVVAPATKFVGKSFLDHRIRTRISKLKEENPNIVVGELHCHSFYSDGYFSVESILNRAASLGLDFVVLTEHLAADRFPMEPVIKSIQDRYQCLQNWKLKNIPPIRAYPAFEISTEQGHLISLFPEEYSAGNDLISLEKRFLPFEQKWFSVEAAAGLTREMGGATVIPHPELQRSYPFGVPISFIKEYLTGLIDGIEDISAAHGFNENYSGSLGLSSIGSSDDHFNFLIGAAVTVYDGDRHNSLVSAIKAKDTRAHSIDNSLAPLISLARKIL
ncbi:MAG: PHP domain-containing protein [Candidatus Nitronauta litoralis]|uniref:PHP domain-containing protein n=1 Tax=Candidatus Nitronauta litoralis TaxID=2705533 RepID=A0A7T0BYL0_9BACT|nr:MAG: PHP domain-containing protein [Candidatus Nitronauta litoralis]